jgi:foldase protein PrsA
MSEGIKNHWFVILIALVLVGFTSFFIYDANRDNVKSKKTDGKDVIASLSFADITADELYDTAAPFDGSLLYNLYKNAVVDQSVETTSAMEEEAKNMESIIDSNVKSQSSDKYLEAVTSELASYGFDGYDKLYDYCLVNVKEKELERAYMLEHFDSLKSALDDKNSRLVSIVEISVSDYTALTEEEQERMDNVDKALESGTFAEAATAFSDDTDTADKEGFAGYIDSDDASSGTSILDATIVAAALELKSGETSDWLAVTDSSTGAQSMVKVHVDTTDPDEILANEDETVQDELLYAILNNSDGLAVHIIQKAAEKLSISFGSDEVKDRLDAYMDTLKGDAVYE